MTMLQAMAKIHYCACLNVSIETAGELDEKERQLVEQSLRLNLPTVKDNLPTKPMAPVRVDENSVKLNLPLLCMERKIGEWSVFVCGICQQETHTRFPSWDSGLILINQNLLSEEMAKKVKKDSLYVPALDLILPMRFTICKKSSELFGLDFTDTPSLDWSNVERMIKHKFREHLYREEIDMKDRIERFTIEQNQHFRVFAEIVQEQQDRFQLMVDSARNHSKIMATVTYDKENDGRLNRRKHFRARFSESIENVDMNQPEGDDTIFGIEDFDDYGNKDDSDEDSGKNERGSIRFKESQNVSMPIEMKSYTSGRGLERMSVGRSNKDANVGSFPIGIPTASLRNNSGNKKNEIDFDEFKSMPVGESMAASIQKMARSVANETGSILDDRPSRRLNTGDLLKHRMHHIGGEFEDRYVSESFT